jgi:hypothetical protein
LLIVQSNITKLALKKFSLLNQYQFDWSKNVGKRIIKEHETSYGWTEEKFSKIEVVCVKKRTCTLRIQEWLGLVSRM